MITPMLVAVVALGSADLMFAVDSIPAIFGLTSEPFLVFSATAFSLLGLRQLYFLIDGLLRRLVYLPYGLAVILGFIGLKLIDHALRANSLGMQLEENLLLASRRGESRRLKWAFSDGDHEKYKEMIAVF